MDFEREVVLDCQFDAPRPAPISEAQSGLEVHFLSAQCGCERDSRFRVGALGPIEGSAVGVLSFYGNSGRSVLREDGFHAALQRAEIGHHDTGFRLDFLRIDVAVAERPPRKVVKKEVQPRFIRRTLPLPVIGLRVVKVGDIVQQPIAFARFSQDAVFVLRHFDGSPGQFVDVVGVICDESDGFAVAGELCRFPCRPNAFKSTGDVRVVSVFQASHRLRRRARRDEIRDNVIAEQVTQNVGAVVHPHEGFSIQVFMCIDQGGFLNVMRQIGWHVLVSCV